MLPATTLGSFERTPYYGWYVRRDGSGVIRQLLVDIDFPRRRVFHVGQQVVSRVRLHGYPSVEIGSVGKVVKIYIPSQSLFSSDVIHVLFKGHDVSTHMKPKELKV